MNPLAWIDDELAALARGDLLRELPGPLYRQGAVIEHAGRRLVNFASNDYLGLAADERLVAAAIAACRDEGVGRGASPLVCGRAAAHVELERRLAEFEDAEAVLLFPTGFAANAGVIPALVGEGDVIYSDAKNHASIIDGCRLSRAEVRVYPHGDVSALEALLAAKPQAAGLRQAGGRRLVVTDTVFSMDGDVAPLNDLADVARRHGAMLLVDEAHATGVFGANGRGVAEQAGLHDPGVIRIGTLSKALGAAGGFVCGSRALVQWLANRARSYVFSTAQPAAASAAACAALDIVVAEPERRTRLLARAEQLRGELRERGWNTGRSASQIIPIVVGEPGAAVGISAALRERGFWVPAIRPPSVPAGESLLRLSLTAGHAEEMIAGLLGALDVVGRRLSPRPATAGPLCPGGLAPGAED
jgi:8-amino-7-oxononanoate synthase